MLNYWWVTRPKRKLDSIPEVLATFAGIALDQEWQGQRNTQILYEDSLEEAGLKRVGPRRDHSGSGGRTYGAWLRSLGLIFTQESTGNIKLTLAGEAIMDGKSPTAILKGQVLKYQFPSSFSLSRNVQVNERFRIHPFVFLLRLLSDRRIEYLTQSEIAKIIIVEAENESEKCYEHIVQRILQYRESGDSCLAPDFFDLYSSGRSVRASIPVSKASVPDELDEKETSLFSRLEDIANTIINWMEYTQLAIRNDDRHLEILPSASEEVHKIINSKWSFIERPEDHEFFQRKYGLDPWHQKDTRNLEKSQTITAHIIEEQKIKQAFVGVSLKHPIASITPELITNIATETGLTEHVVEDTLMKFFPHGAIGSFMASYFEMAFSGREEATEFEIATTDIFKTVFGYDAKHFGQGGSKSVPDILLLSDSEGYQAIIDNKAYAKYSISGDHHNRMVHNYIEKIASYSDCNYPIGFFSYISGGFGSAINKQLKDEVKEANVHGSGITISTFIKMIENQSNGTRYYSHADMRRIFSVDREILMQDLQ